MSKNKDVLFGATLGERIAFSPPALSNNWYNVQKFGYNSSVGSTFETIWDGGGVYAYAGTPGTAAVTSTDTGSDNGGTVQVFGLDGSYNLVDETLTIGGGAGTQTFSRVFRAILKTANTGNSNVGTLTVTVDSTAVAQIQPTYGQTLMAVYTVPAGYKAYMIQMDVGSSKDLENEVKLRTKEIANGNVWNTKSFISTRGGFTEKSFRLPLVINEKTDIEVFAKASATSSISAGFEIIVEKQD